MEMFIRKSGERRKCTKEFSLVLKLIMIVNLTGAAQLRGWKRMVNQNSNFQIIQNKKKKKKYVSIGSSGIESLTMHCICQPRKMTWAFFSFFSLTHILRFSHKLPWKKQGLAGLTELDQDHQLKVVFSNLNHPNKYNKKM